MSPNSKTNQSQSALCAQQLLSKGADFVMPSCDFDFGSPAARIADKAGKVAIGCAGGLAYGYQGVGPLLFNTYSGSATEGALLAKERGNAVTITFSQNDSEATNIEAGYRHFVSKRLRKHITDVMSKQKNAVLWGHEPERASWQSIQPPIGRPHSRHIYLRPVRRPREGYAASINRRADSNPPPTES